MDRPSRIHILVSFCGSGGAQFAALRLARGLRERGHDPSVLFLYQQGPIDDPDHDYEVLLPETRPRPTGYLRIALKLLRYMRQERPDVVLSFLPLAHVAGQSAAALAGVRRRIVSHRTPVTTISRTMFVLDAIAAWLGVYTGVVAVSRSVRDSCRHYPAWLRARTGVVYNGLRAWTPSRLSRSEARQRFSAENSAFLLVAVGRLAEQKNYPLMIRIMERLDGADLLIAGDGPLRAEIESDIAARRLTGRVRLLGAVSRPEIPDLLAAADVFIQTSTFEGQSNSVLEALYSGLPVVAHDIPEQRETIADEEGNVAGALVPLGDLEGWAASIRRLVQDPAEAERARIVARDQAARFRYETMIEGFESALGS